MGELSCAQLPVGKKQADNDTASAITTDFTGVAADLLNSFDAFILLALKLSGMLMRVLHAAKFANAQALAFQLQLRLTHRIGFAGLQALGGVFMGRRHRPVARNVFFGGLIQLGRIRYKTDSCHRNSDKG
jgi:hypothetical protein